ncbi:MAG: hypothetical protein Q4F97_07240 [Bacteroidales bacterium]|nr:hypothetical protein [Bacteroidales bacterium]
MIVDKIKNLKKISCLNNNSVFDSEIKDNFLPIYGAYHIFCSRNWKNLVKNQVNKLIKSELYKYVNKIYVSVIYNEESDIKYLKNLLSDRFEIVIISQNPSDYEMPILNYIWEKSKSEDFFLFYFHTKGVSLNDSACDRYLLKHPHYNVSFDFMRDCNEKWRILMEYFQIDKFNIAINSLNNGFNAYGVIYRLNNKGNHFSGNFWWASSKYIKTLPPINFLDYGRWNAEFWIGKGEDFKPYVPYNNLFDPYFIPIPSILYTKRKILFSDVTKVFKCYYYHFKLIVYGAIFK